MEITHIKKPFKRSYTLKIDTSGNLKVITNSSFSSRKVKLLIEKHLPWIDKTRERILAHQEKIKQNKKKFTTGERFNILGVEYLLELRSTLRKYPKAFLENDLIVVDQGRNSLTHEEVKKVFIKLLKKILYDYIENRSIYYLHAYNLSANKITIKNHSTRWGSCSNKKNLNFNIKLIFCPLEMIDYVVVHEICHLKEMNHSKRFWDLVSKEFPHYKAIRKWFKDNGPSIMNMI